MAGERITVDELLARQSSAPSAGMRATIEPVEGDDTQVTITPFDRASGCLCSESLSIPKAEIESITTTDEVHHCCGRQLTVVDIAFQNATVADIFRQVSVPPPSGGEPGRRAGHPPLPYAAFPGPRAVDHDFYWPIPSRFPVSARGPSTTDYIHCILQRTACYLACSLGTDYCACVCESVFNTCLDPTFPPAPC